jgi:hypothetical protein
MGRPASEDHFDNLIEADAEGIDAETGRVVFKLRKHVIPQHLIENVRDAYGDVDTLESPSVTRRAAAGLIDVSQFKKLRSDVVGIVPLTPTTGRLQLADGRILKQPVSNPVHSYLAGFSCTRFGGRNVIGRLTRRYPDRWFASIPYFQRVDRVLAREMPEIYVKHSHRCALHPLWRIPDTALSTVTINVNYESRYHYDVGDFREGYSTLSVAEIGRYAGGYLVFPAYRIAIDVRESDVLLCQSHIDMHGNTPMLKRTRTAKRVSFVTYLKHKLAEGVNRDEDPMTAWNPAKVDTAVR